MTEAQAREWCDAHRKHPEIGKAIQGAQSWQPDGLSKIVAHIFNLAEPAPAVTSEEKIREYILEFTGIPIDQDCDPVTYLIAAHRSLANGKKDI